LRGNRKGKGLVDSKKGEWIANQVFVVPINEENIFENFFINNKVKFNKKFLLMH